MSEPLSIFISGMVGVFVGMAVLYVSIQILGLMTRKRDKKVEQP